MKIPPTFVTAVVTQFQEGDLGKEAPGLLEGLVLIWAGGGACGAVTVHTVAAQLFCQNTHIADSYRMNGEGRVKVLTGIFEPCPLLDFSKTTSLQLFFSQRKLILVSRGPTERTISKDRCF